MKKILVGICALLIGSTMFVGCEPSNKTYSSTKTSSSYSTSANKCEYKYPDGSKCGAKCSSGKTLCDKHMKELTDIYNSFVGD